MELREVKFKEHQFCVGPSGSFCPEITVWETCTAETLDKRLFHSLIYWYVSIILTPLSLSLSLVHLDYVQSKFFSASQCGRYLSRI
jgi:hypothetical protein